jgi:hypothetical protein
MATTVYQSVEIELFSGKVLVLRPLKLSLLRKFMREFEGLSDVASDNDQSLSKMVDCVAIAMQQYDPELAKDKEAIEDELDLPTIYKIIEVASGIKMDDSDPNLVAGLSG